MGSIGEPTWIQPDTSYEIPMSTLYDPDNRKIRVIIIGAGLSGIMMSYKIQQECENVEQVIYERNPEAGGTWYENRYPGCACDTPAHAYAYPWAPNPDYPRMLSQSKDIKSYMDRCIDCFELGQYINYNHQVASCVWNNDLGRWKVKVQQIVPKTDLSSTEPQAIVGEFEDECEVLLHATGILNRWEYPDIPGLKSFKGRVCHTAGWPDDYTQREWSGQKVVMIGSGASSIQAVPAMQPDVKHMDVYVRSPIWFVQILQNTGNQKEYTEEERDYFRKHPDKFLASIKELEDQFNSRYEHNIVGTKEQKALAKMVEDRMRSMIKDERILNGLLPDFPVNCRRPTPGDPYMKAIQEENVTMHFTSVERITPTGVVDSNGQEVECDTIVCATGFDNTHCPRFPVIGKDGVNLQDLWKRHAEAYFSVANVNMPNWVTFMGPNWPVAAGSIMAALDGAGDFAISMIKKLQRDQIRSICPSKKASDAYNLHTQTWGKLVVFGNGCRTWYKDNESGRLRAVYPGSAMHLREVLANPRWEDMDIEYLDPSHPYKFMGIGRHMCQTEKGRATGWSPSPYYSAERIDKRWKY